MISNPAPVLVRPEANGQNAPVPPHDALCTQLNPLVQVQCAVPVCHLKNFGVSFEID